MINLFDACSIKHGFCFTSVDDYIDTVKSYCDSGVQIAISDEIQKELYPTISLSEKDPVKYEVANSIHLHTELLIKAQKLKVICVSDDAHIKENYMRTRKDHYSWMTDPAFCMRLIRQGRLSEPDYRSNGFRYKDVGECSLIAIALTNINDYIIVSEDKGRVYCHPDINIFNCYREKGVIIIKYIDWVRTSVVPA